MLNRRDILNKILALRPDLTEEDLQKIIQKKQEGTSNLLTEEGATYMVANEFGIDLTNGKVTKTDLKVKDLIVGANDATITGQVIAISPLRTFVRRDGVEGKVARLLISDETGTINVVLWNEKTSILTQERVVPDQTIRVSHGYVRAGLNGKPELNVGRRGMITILSSTPSLNNISKKKIQHLEEGAFVNLNGIIKGFSRISSFTRGNQRPGRVMRVRLVDDTGRIRAVFWDNKVDEVKNNQIGDVIEIIGGQVRRGLGDALEVHVGSLSKIRLLPDANIPLIAPNLVKINDLNIGLNDVDVLGRIVSVGIIREFERRSGTTGKVGSLFLMDETGYIRLTLWDDKVDVLNEVSTNDAVLIEGGYTREGIEGVVELNLGSLGSVTINPPMKDAQTLPQSGSHTIRISELKIGMGDVFVEGELVGEPVIRDVTSRDGEDLRVASLRIKDTSGEINVTLWRDLAEYVEELDESSALRINNAYVRMGFYGALELSSGSRTTIEILKKVIKKPHNVQSLVDDLFFDKINNLHDGQSVKVKGKIVDVSPNSRVYPSCPNCKKRVEKDREGWICSQCGSIVKPYPRLTVDIVLEDDSGNINTIFNGDEAERLLGISGDYAWTMAIQANDESTPISNALAEVIGNEIRVEGRVTRDQRDDRLRLFVNTFSNQ